jgi:hypothetical protein
VVTAVGGTGDGVTGIIVGGLVTVTVAVDELLPVLASGSDDATRERKIRSVQYRYTLIAAGPSTPL